VSDSNVTSRDRIPVRKGKATSAKPDLLAVEEPLEIRLRNEAISVTMRTPGNDFELAAGFLFTEGILHSAGEIGSMRHCDEAEERNIVDVHPADGVQIDTTKLQRNFYATSSCGICGKASIDQIRTLAPPFESDLKVSPSLLETLPGAMRRKQEAFDKTGGLHAAGIFDGTGKLLALREDVGRHNAVDKAIGHLFLQEKVPLDQHILMVSGRASFEILQKARMASLPIVCAVSAPSSLAVDFAVENGMTLVGFLRGSEMNIYAGKERITP
jgi:FdhD protein